MGVRRVEDPHHPRGFRELEVTSRNVTKLGPLCRVVEKGGDKLLVRTEKAFAGAAFSIIGE
jgi:hypothetical protein